MRPILSYTEDDRIDKPLCKGFMVSNAELFWPSVKLLSTSELHQFKSSSAKHSRQMLFTLLLEFVEAVNPPTCTCNSNLCFSLGLPVSGRDAEKNSMHKPDLLCQSADHRGSSQRSRHSHKPKPVSRAKSPQQYGDQGSGRGGGWGSGGSLIICTYQRL